MCLVILSIVAGLPLRLPPKSAEQKTYNTTHCCSALRKVLQPLAAAVSPPPLRGAEGTCRKWESNWRPHGTGPVTQPLTQHLPEDSTHTHTRTNGHHWTAITSHLQKSRRSLQPGQLRTMCTYLLHPVLHVQVPTGREEKHTITIHCSHPQNLRNVRTCYNTQRQNLRGDQGRNRRQDGVRRLILGFCPSIC